MTAKNSNIDTNEFYDSAPLTKMEIFTFIFLAILGISINIAVIDLGKNLIVEKINYMQVKDNHRDNQK